MLFDWEEQWVQTAFSQDAAHVERNLADDLRYVTGDGSVIGKQAMIDSWIVDPNDYTSWVIDTVEAHGCGDDLVTVIGSDTNRGADSEGNEFVCLGGLHQRVHAP